MQAGDQRGLVAGELARTSEQAVEAETRHVEVLAGRVDRARIGLEQDQRAGDAGFGPFLQERHERVQPGVADVESMLSTAT